MEQFHTVPVGNEQYAVIAIDPKARTARWVKPEPGKALYKSRQAAAWHREREEKKMDIQEEKENALLLALCQEAGSEGTREELIQGARANHHPEDIQNAANGDVASLVQLRRDFGLSIIV